MSAWRRKAIEAFPEHRGEFEEPDATIYTVFHVLLRRCIEAPNDETAARIFAFAEQSFRQGGDVGNAAAVSFYEHCGEREHSRDQFIRRIPVDIYRDVRPLLVGRIDERRVAVLDRAFERKAMGKGR